MYIFFLPNCVYLVQALLNSLYISLSVLPVVEISAAPITKKTAKIKEAPRRLIDLTVFTFTARQVNTLPMVG